MNFPESGQLHILQPKLIIEKILFIDGQGRAGKNLLGKIISNFSHIEYYQYQPIIEQLPVLSHLKIMSRADAIAYLGLNLNMYIYERAIGRNLNMRCDDSSCIMNSTEFEMFENRRKSPISHEDAIAELHTKERVPSFMTHGCLPHIDLYLEGYSQFMMVNIQRHPIDLSYSWDKRDIGKRFGVDPIITTPAYKKGRIGVPWYALNWEEDYNQMSPTDRCIKGIVTMHRFEQEAYERNNDKKDSVLRISYERLFEEPYLVIDEIQAFLGEEPFSNMNEVLAREGCPRELLLEERRTKFELLKSKASPALIKELMEVSLEYEKAWEMPRVF